MKLILVIEDNFDVRENIVEILELANYKTITAEDGRRGIELAQQDKPDLIICDIMMPELDGYGVLHLLSKSPQTSTIPFVFLTAKTERNDVRKGMRMGADDYLTKPFDDVDLLDAVEIRLRRNESIKNNIVNDLNSITQLILDARGTEGLETLITDQRKTTIYKKKQQLYTEGKNAASLFFIARGRVKTFKTNDEGREFITGLHGSGEFLGYQNILENAVYTESAMALDDTEVYIITTEEFFAILSSSQEISNKFIKMLSDNLIEREERLLQLAFNSVRKRVAESLLMLYANFHKEGKADEFTIALYREDLAALAGASKETVIRALSDFKDEGLIQIVGRKITILSLDKLQRMKN